jgi:hypothetical protein
MNNREKFDIYQCPWCESKVSLGIFKKHFQEKHNKDPTQFHNYKNDILKQELAARQGYILLILWEHDFKNKTPEYYAFIEQLKQLAPQS